MMFGMSWTSSNRKNRLKINLLALGLTILTLAAYMGLSFIASYIISLIAHINLLYMTILLASSLMIGALFTLLFDMWRSHLIEIHDISHVTYGIYDPLEKK